MKQFIIAGLSVLMLAGIGIAMPAQADASLQCDRLRNRVQSWRRIRNRYLARWSRCRRYRGSYSRKCRRLRRKFRRWSARTNAARADYRRWRCHFTWNRWDGPGGGSGTYRASKCRSLASQVASWRRIRNRYIARWNRCKWRRGTLSSKCQYLRRRVNAWYRNVNAARANYSRWGCRFSWNQWNDPWAGNGGSTYQAAKCRSLANQVTTWRSIRNRYLARWSRCRRYRGSYSGRCLRLRRKFRSWSARTRAARANYSRWGCRFTWNRWDSPWGAPTTPPPSSEAPPTGGSYRAAKCRSLASQVRSWRRIRNRYLARWSRCRRYRGSYSRRCRRLRRKFRRWSARTNAARANYSRWGCRFTWNRWDNP